MRPPACRSCHAAMNEATVDRPGIKVAFHRQCIGCHIAMGIAKQGCTDCHAAKEVQS
jgi:formate-dependent nitrite reductase cytochrome c552 subunit